MPPTIRINITSALQPRAPSALVLPASLEAAAVEAAAEAAVEAAAVAAAAVAAAAVEAAAVEAAAVEASLSCERGTTSVDVQRVAQVAD